MINLTMSFKGKEHCTNEPRGLGNLASVPLYDTSSVCGNSLESCYNPEAITLAVD